ncbi:flagellar basal body rod protein FlgB [Lacibacterium aquatile]|uniref:Flagellar basal body rod protein FlgB n=1 Tax=Lacibacterium aquatile TaxID=1168082 RepID=A0ABW5DMV0_9PROT
MIGSKPTLFALIDQRMNYLGERHKVLTQNIANADTPGYQARDLRDANFLQALRSAQSNMPLAQTQSGHLPPLRAGSNFAVDKVKKPYETSTDGNGVVIEEQMMKATQNSSDYQVATELYHKYIGMLKTAASRGMG